MPSFKPKPALKSAPKTNETKLARLGLHTDMDLVLHLPMRYEDETQVVSIREACLRGGHVSQVEGVVTKNEISLRPRRQLLVTIADETGDMVLRFMNFYGSQVKQLAEGTRVRARGELKHGFFGAEMVHPAYKVVLQGAPLPTVLTPVYPSGEGLSQPILRRAIFDAMARVDWRDTLPPALVKSMNLANFEASVRLLHSPPQEIDEYALMDRSHPAWVRMKFDELLAQQLSLKRAQRARRAKGAPVIKTVGTLTEAFTGVLPFQLTGAQARVLEEIRADLRHPYPMQRLLQGDVGSGKTAVALYAMLLGVANKMQSVLLAPTEVLAEQHYLTLTRALAGSSVVVELFTGRTKKQNKGERLKRLASGKINLAVGTQALIQEDVEFANLGLVVVDEQHRFGVEQRAALTGKTHGTSPHVLVMTATPIPRTVAMTVFGDLETSVLAELPAGRAPIQTNVVPLVDQPQWIARVWERVREEVAKGHQVYVVCPRISGDTLEEGESDQLDVDEDGEVTTKRVPLAAVEDLHDELSGGPLQGLRTAILHGRLPPDEKDRTMRAFAAGEVDVLISTTVIEVGVDVHNATMMVLLDADRFGVSQLHQLRGRVGRGGLPGLCLLVSRAEADTPARERLDAVASTTDGFELSRVDLEQRREGDVLGANQSGFHSSLITLRVLRDEKTIVRAREAADELLAEDADLAPYPGLAAAVADIEASQHSEFVDKS